MKKEFTHTLSKAYNEKSDIELIEVLISTDIGPSLKDGIKAILDYRLKKVLNHLKEVTEKSSLATARQNRIMIWLTIVLVFLTVVLLVKS